jgi:hypothetical protein
VWCLILRFRQCWSSPSVGRRPIPICRSELRLLSPSQTSYAHRPLSVTSLCNRVAVLTANPGVRADRPRRAVISQILREFTLISAIRR